MSQGRCRRLSVGYIRGSWTILVCGQSCSCGSGLQLTPNSGVHDHTVPLNHPVVHTASLNRVACPVCRCCHSLSRQTETTTDSMCAKVFALLRDLQDDLCDYGHSIEHRVNTVPLCEEPRAHGRVLFVSIRLSPSQ